MPWQATHSGCASGHCLDAQSTRLGTLTSLKGTKLVTTAGWLVQAGRPVPVLPVLATAVRANLHHTIDWSGPKGLLFCPCKHPCKSQVLSWQATHSGLPAGMLTKVAWGPLWPPSGICWCLLKWPAPGRPASACAPGPATAVCPLLMIPLSLGWPQRALALPLQFPCLVRAGHTSDMCLWSLLGC